MDLATIEDVNMIIETYFKLLMEQIKNNNARYITVAMAAEKLSVSKKTIYTLLQTDESFSSLVFKINDMKRFRESDIDNWMIENRNKDKI